MYMYEKWDAHAIVYYLHIITILMLYMYLGTAYYEHSGVIV